MADASFFEIDDNEYLSVDVQPITSHQVLCRRALSVEHTKCSFKTKYLKEAGGPTVAAVFPRNEEQGAHRASPGPPMPPLCKAQLVAAAAS